MKQQRGSGRQPKPPAGKGGGKPRGKITKSSKPKSVKNQIRDMERLLAKVWDVACSLEGPRDALALRIPSAVHSGATREAQVK